MILASRLGKTTGLLRWFDQVQMRFGFVWWFCLVVLCFVSGLGKAGSHRHLVAGVVAKASCHTLHF
jgi:hypothetical protein